MQHVICTGNIGNKERYQELCSLAPNVHVVKGQFDQDLGLPEVSVLQVGQFRIGVIHGHQLLPFGSHRVKSTWRRKLGVDILVSGNSHKNEVVLQDGCYHINPVSGSQATRVCQRHFDRSSNVRNTNSRRVVSSGLYHRCSFVPNGKCHPFLHTPSDSGGKAGVLRLRIDQGRCGRLQDRVHQSSSF